MFDDVRNFFLIMIMIKNLIEMHLIYIYIYISIGAEAGILESKGKLEKRSKKYSLDYKIVEREGDWFIVQDADGQKKIKAFRNSCN